MSGNRRLFYRFVLAGLVASILSIHGRAEAQPSPGASRAAANKAMREGDAAFQARDHKTAISDFNAAAAAFERLGDTAAANDARVKAAGAECNELMQALPAAIGAGKVTSTTTLKDYNPRFEAVCKKAGLPNILTAARQTIAQGHFGPVAKGAPPRPGPLTPERGEQAQFLFERGFELLQSGDLQGARTGFEKGLAIDPANVAANLYMAETLVRLDEADRARTFYNKVVALDPGSTEAHDAQAGLAELDTARIDADNRIVFVAAADAPFKTFGEFVTYGEQLRARKPPVGADMTCTAAFSEAELRRCHFNVSDPQYCVAREESTSCTAARRVWNNLRKNFWLMLHQGTFASDHILSSSDLSPRGRDDGVFIVAALPMAHALQAVRHGKLNALAVTGPTRSPNLPEVPTLAELGVSGS